MPTPLSDYYRELQQREALQILELVANWNANVVEVISVDFRNAMAASQINRQAVPIRPASTNQSIGNQVADFFTLQFPQHLSGHEVRACAGAGYPDKILVAHLGGATFPLELKATSSWDAADSNRRVLTSSSRKLRDRFTRRLTICWRRFFISKMATPGLSIRSDWISSVRTHSSTSGLRLR